MADLIQITDGRGFGMRVSSSIVSMRRRIACTLALSSAGVFAISNQVFALTNCPGGAQTVSENLGLVTTNPYSACVTIDERVECANLSFSGPGPISQQHTFSASIGCGTETLTVNYTGTYGIPGYLDVKYVVLGVTYPPPGAKSSVAYNEGFTAGTAQNLSNSFSSSNAVTVSASAGGGVVVGGSSGSGSGNSGSGVNIKASGGETVTGTMTQTSNSSSTLSITQTQTNTATLMGPTSSALGVDHMFDQIEVWVNPELYVALTGTNSIVVLGYVTNPADTAADGSPDVVYLTVGELLGSQTIASNVQTVLNRTWDTKLGGLTTADFQTIAGADPFSFNSGFNPNSDTSGRYVFPDGTEQTFSFEPEPAGEGAQCTGYTSTYNSSQNTSTGGSNAFSVSDTVDSSISIGAFVSFSADVKDISTYTYTNSWSSTVTSGSSQSATTTICRPLSTDDYTGPINMQIWKDNVYGTFMYFPVD
jgi:hypothetical protein